MKSVILGLKLIFTAVIFTIALTFFSACEEVPVEPSDSLTSSQAEISETKSKASPESSTSKAQQNTGSEPAYIDTFFTEDTYIKYCNASEEPNFESVYRFDANGIVTYSYNMWEGFIQSTEKYFIRKYRNGIYQIFTYKDSKDAAKVLFTVYNDKDISADASASFITEKEFREIYAFHQEWNKQAAECGDE